MRKTFRYTSILLSVLFFTFFTDGILAQGISAKDIQDPKKVCATCYVSNPDGILTKEAVEKINEKLEALFRKTTAQVAVVAIKGDETTSARDLSMELFDLWKPGGKGKDNGLIIVLCVESRDVFLRTGYGLEGALPDAATTRIFNRDMAPYFKKGEWDKGLSAGVDAVCDKLYAEYEDNGFAQKEPVDLMPYVQTYILYSLFSDCHLCYKRQGFKGRCTPQDGTYRRFEEKLHALADIGNCLHACHVASRYLGLSNKKPGNTESQDKVRLRQYDETLIGGRRGRIP